MHDILWAMDMVNDGKRVRREAWDKTAFLVALPEWYLYRGMALLNGPKLETDQSIWKHSEGKKHELWQPEQEDITAID